jgi:hypothetical protein
MRLLLTTIIAALLLTAPAGARVKPGLYVGKTDAGKPVKLRVKGARVTASAKLGVKCVRFAGFDPAAKPELSSYVSRLFTEDDDGIYVPISDGAFSFSNDAIESGTGGEGSTTTFDGTFRGSRVEGNVSYESSYNSSATGSNGACDGSTTYTARRVPTK